MDEQRLTIDGPAGILECIVNRPTHWQEGDPVAIACHPHPLHGGTLNNKVVHILAKTFAELGALVLRFNFRGVGKSQGEFDNGQGEQDDLLAAVAYLRQHHPRSPLWLSGFSFGAGMALAAHARIQPQRLLLVAPAVDMYPQLADVQVATPGWVLVQGADDEVVSPRAVMHWVGTQALKPRLLWLEETGHFFHGQLTRLNERIRAIWSETP